MLPPPPLYPRCWLLHTITTSFTKSYCSMNKTELQETAEHLSLDIGDNMAALKEHIEQHIMDPTRLHNLIANENYTHLYPIRFRNTYQPSASLTQTPNPDFPEWGGIPSQPSTPTLNWDSTPHSPTPESSTQHLHSHSHQPPTDSGAPTNWLQLSLPPSEFLSLSISPL